MEPDTVTRDTPAAVASETLQSEVQDGNSDRLVDLTFDWREHVFHAHLNRKSVGECQLNVTCDIGPVPFTAEGVQRRLNIFAILGATKTGMNFRTFISPNQRINMIGETTLPAPVTTSTLITGIVSVLTQARPYLDLFEILQISADSVRTGQ